MPSNLSRNFGCNRTRFSESGPAQGCTEPAGNDLAMIFQTVRTLHALQATHTLRQNDTATSPCSIADYKQLKLPSGGMAAQSAKSYPVPAIENTVMPDDASGLAAVGSRLMKSLPCVGAPALQGKACQARQTESCQ